jgi:hypothetical protein
MKKQEAKVETSQVIVNQGSVPLAQQTDILVPAANKGRMKVRGYGLQLRANTFVVR